MVSVDHLQAAQSAGKWPSQRLSGETHGGRAWRLVITRERNGSSSRDQKNPSLDLRYSGPGERFAIAFHLANKKPSIKDKLGFRVLLLLFVSLSSFFLLTPVCARSARQAVSGQSVPYKTFYITRACEWKSNLFVPKSNDIHFAQSTATEQQQLDASFSQQQPVADLALPMQQQKAAITANQQDGSSSRTMLSTDSKALVLALPIVMSQSFAGYEPACSIRLIVPRNMRILAKLTYRRLSLAIQQLDTATGSLDWSAQQVAAGEAPSVWLNVSQDQFIETEHRTIETEGNVLAFRFLLDRFANKQLPETRFQVVLTAFQTLSENSDLLQQQQQQNTQNSQFICDQQRLISANLACDGFKNCQDGHDEELATCLALRTNLNHLDVPSAATPARLPENQVPPNAINGLDSQQSNEAANLGFTGRIWQLARDSNSLAGFLFGFLLVLALLTCCVCCLYLCYLISRKQLLRGQPTAWWLAALARFSAATGGGEAGVSGESLGRRAETSGRREAQQNTDNLARQKFEEAREPLKPAKPLQSILKKPATTERPSEPPPAVPERIALGPPELRRGALASSLRNSARLRLPQQLAGQDFRPTPAKRLTRPPSRPAPIPGASGSTTSTTSVSTGTQRVTTYHFSSGSTRFSSAYLDRLAEQQRRQPPDKQHPQQQHQSPPSGYNVNYPTSEVARESISPQSSLI